MTNVVNRVVRVTMLLAFTLFASGVSFSPTQAANEVFTLYTDSGNNDQAMLTSLIHAFESVNPDVHVVIDVGPVGETSVQLVKTRLIAGKMDDVFIYFSGSLFQSLNPTKYLVDLSNQTWQSKILPSFVPAVSIGARKYGAPIGSAMGGGILYNKRVFSKLGLKIPLTWSQFMKNNSVIKQAGVIPLIQTYKDGWTSQFLVLADEFNLQATNPNFPALYTSKQVGFSTIPAAMAGFQHLEDVHKAGYQNRDYATATMAMGLKYLATGAGAQYPMFTAVASNIEKDYPTLSDNIGLFALPGKSSASNGLTMWMPTGLFISNSSKHLLAAKKFLAFATTPAGIAAISKAVPLTGPYMVKGVTLTGHLSTITKDMLRYVDAGKIAPALEYVSPIKGPNLPDITVKVGSGLMTAKQGAVAYDKDVQKELVRIGLPGWGPLTN